jgi:hypothetical protein
MPRGYPTHIQKAFDELRFGHLRTLNLRESLPTANDARVRVEAWVRAKQMERAGEVLIITGRGNSSPGGVSVVRQSVLALFPSLRRRNIITGWQEHTAGSFVVALAPLTALFEAPKRRRERQQLVPVPPTLAALAPETRVLLQDLATASLAALGVQDFERFLESEMLAKFSTLSAALTESDDPDTALQAAIQHALDELQDNQ